MTTLPKDYRPREGDTVLVHAIVKYSVDDDDDNVHLAPAGAPYQSYRVPISKIVGLYARAWSEGKAVLDRSREGDRGIVLATHEDKVWVAFEEAGVLTIDANDLDPAPEIVEPPSLVRPPPFPGAAAEEEGTPT